MDLFVTRLRGLIQLKRIAFLLFFSVFLSYAQAQDIVYVASGSTCTVGCGGSWAMAYSDLKEALMATDSGQIWVAKGTYRSADCPGTCQNIDRLESLNLKSNVALYGGFFGDETALDQRDIVTNETFLSGNIGFDNNQSDNSLHVVVARNVDSTAILDGFIIRDGLANGNFGNNNEYGAGLYIDATNMEISAPTIRNCIFTINEADKGGGAVFVAADLGGTAKPTFEDCLFLDNSAGMSGGSILHSVSAGNVLSPTYRRCTFEENIAGLDGGAIAVLSNGMGTISTPKIVECTFNNNRATNDGGAIYSNAEDNAFHRGDIQSCFFFRNEVLGSAGALFDQANLGAVSTSYILNCHFNDNLSNVNGGAVYLRGSQSASNFSLLFNCIFELNGTIGSGGGIYTTSALDGVDLGVCRPQIINCTFFNNYAEVVGDALFNDFSNTELSNSILWNSNVEIGNNNSNPTIKDCIIKGGYSDLGSFSNISEADPFFLNPEAGDFHLSFCSPAIDIGVSTDIPIDSTDLDADASTTEQIDIDADGMGRTFGTTVDLGALEWSGSPAEGDVIFVNQNAVGNNDGSSWDNAYTDLQSALSTTYPCADIWVAAGVYIPVTCAGVCTDLERATSFRMINQVAIYGGFRGVENTLEERDVVGNETILSGNIGDLNDIGDNSFHILFADNIDSTGILDGFTIMDGNANDPVGIEIQGGGLYVDALSGRANPTIRNCTFRANNAEAGGAAVYNEADNGGVLGTLFENCSFISNEITGLGSGAAVCHNIGDGGILNPVFRSCTFTGNNSSQNGGAVAHNIKGGNTVSQPQYYDCLFQGNNASVNGGALFANVSGDADHQMIIQNSTFQENSAAAFGGAIFEMASQGGNSTSRIINAVFRSNRAEDGAAIYIGGTETGRNRTVIFNALFDENQAQQNGGGLFNSGALDGANTGNCEPTIINCTFSGNSALSGLAIYNDFANPEINNSIMWDGGDEISDNQSAPIVQNCVIQDGYQGDGFVLNVIEEDPLFLNILGDDFRLVACSPAVDQGLSGAIPFDNTDVDADNDNNEQIDIDLLESLRLFGDQVDLGAFEWNGFPEALTVQIQKDDVSCFGACDGSVSIDPEGGTGNFLIAWSDGQDAFGTNDLCPGDYQLTVTDGSLCTVVDSVEIIENDELEIMVTPDTTVCDGTEAPLTAIGVGGAGGYTYLWSENLGEGSNVSFSPQSDQEIIVIVTDDNGCLKLDSIDVTLAENPLPSIIGPAEVCVGDSIMLQTEVFEQYNWSSGQETAAVNVSEGGNYELTVTDANGCIGVAMTDVAELATPEPTIMGDTAFCAGTSTQLEVGLFEGYEWSTDSDEPSITVTEANTYSVVVTNADGCEGEAMVIVIENTLPIVEISGDLDFCEGDSTSLAGGSFVSYAWSTSDTSATIFATAEGTYQLTVTDDNGCEGEDAVEVSTNDSPEVDIIGEPKFCEGDSTFLNVGLFETYEWSTGGMTDIISVNSAGSYSVTVSNENDCIASASVEVIENALPIVEIEGNPGFCPGDSTLLEVGPFSGYLWSTGAMTPLLYASVSSEYSITVTDENGCAGKTQIEVEAFAQPTVEIMGNQAFCEGDSTILTTGTFESYAWTGGTTSPTLSVLEGGNYGLTVTDENNCEAETTVEIAENPIPMVVITGEEGYCENDSTQLDAGLFASYLWSTTEETQFIDANQPGLYEVAVTDDNGCMGMASIEINEFALPEPEIEGLLSFCDGGSTTLNTGPFEAYEWSTGGMDAEETIMEIGTFSVTVEDSNGCLGISTVDVTQAEDIEFEIIGSLAFCDGDSTQLDAGDFDTYEWSTGEMTSSIMADMSGTYSVTVTDVAGCTGENEVMVQEDSPIEVAIEGEMSFCEGSTTTLLADAGFANYDWSTEDISNSIEVDASGTYTVTVTDDNGCMAIASVDVEEAPALMPAIAGNLSICEGEATILEVGAYESYLWTGGVMSAVLETTTGGLFSVTVTDENGCIGEAEATVEAIGQPQAEIQGVSDGICEGESVELLASGNGDFSWIDTDGSLSVISPDLAIATPMQATTYGLVVSNACFTDTTFLELQIFNPPMVDAGSDIVIKEGEEVRLDASGASSYEWSGANYLSCVSCASPLASPDSTFNFTVTGTDSNGCQDVDSIIVTVLTGDVKLVDPVNAFTPNNDGVNDFFVIKEIEQFPDHKLTVFNRWGDTVYESLDYQNGWDGTYNGTPLPAGTYLYILVINAAGEKQVIRSTITIVRE